MPRVIRVAIPAPLRRLFDYLIPPDAMPVYPGVRVRVPFGRRQAIGVIWEIADDSEVPQAKLRAATEVIDAEPLLSPVLLRLLQWTADYYEHPLGDVIQTALPVLLRQGQPAAPPQEERWALTVAGRKLATPPGKRAPTQAALWQLLLDNETLSPVTLTTISVRWRKILTAWQTAGWVTKILAERVLPAHPAPLLGPHLALNPAQVAAVGAVGASLGEFHVHLLHGVTGSGKTEVYLEAIAQVLAQSRQALVLVPEIGLTPQLLARFQVRFSVPIALLHSGLTESERLQAWVEARAGRAPIVIGTRSAVFTPCARLGLIVVDEEHDPSYKQQDGLRYHARDVAIMRARDEAVPIVLGSATPSLESLHNAAQGRYRALSLPARAGVAQLPSVELLDARRLALHDGLSHPLLTAIGERLARGEQSLLFLNRRGFAPALMCTACGWLAPCPRCDARLTVHKRSGRLRCHHCGGEQPLTNACANCAATALVTVGAGTERVEAALARQFPQARIERIDRDTTQRKGELQARLARVATGEADILVGTQMLAKGHDFPRVTLVGVLQADQGLHGLDFRAGEQLFAQILQVSGRAGRADKPGQVLVQTHYPEHPLFQALRTHDFSAYAAHALAERAAAGYPPFSYLALLRAEAAGADAALRFLEYARTIAAPHTEAVQLMQPVPSPMERRAGRYRAQLLVQARERAALHALLRPWLQRLEEDKQARRVRWSIDVDPMTLY